MLPLTIFPRSTTNRFALAILSVAAVCVLVACFTPSPEASLAIGILHILSFPVGSGMIVVTMRGADSLTLSTILITANLCANAYIVGWLVAAQQRRMKPVRLCPDCGLALLSDPNVKRCPKCEDEQETE